MTARLFHFALFLVCFLNAGNVFAQGTCPASAPVSGTKCYFIAANGSDTNSGTSESSPWAHAPGMPNCANNCAAVTPAAGQGFIFRGGDTWHFGNSGASPYTGGTFAWHWSGTSGSPIYIGVDPSWYSGGSWARPIFNADNPLSTSAVASCPYQVGGSNNMLDGSGGSYTTYDNFELLGLCQSDANAPFAHDNYLIDGYVLTNFYNHLYIHGWTHTPFSCSGGAGQCANLQIAQNVQNIFQMVADGSDSDPGGLERGIYGGCYNISQSVFRYVVGFVCGNFHTFHDNLMEYLYQPGDNYSHGNVLESVGEWNANNVFYNNVIRHVCNTGCAVVGWWLNPSQGHTDYIFNNVNYDMVLGTSDYFLLGNNRNQPNLGNYTIFNNTFENPIGGASGAVLVCLNLGPTYSFTAVNNQYIADQGPYAGPCSTYGTTTNELTMNHTTATAQGYTASETYAYSPSSPTVGTGTNVSGTFCSTLSGSSDSLLQAAGAACKSDTGYACTYNGGDHTVSCPARSVAARPANTAWSKGAYEYSSTSTTSATPAPPSNLAATVQN